MLIPIPDLQAAQAEIEQLKSRRLKILRALEFTLNTIKKSAGYSNDVPTVTFDAKSWKDMPDPQCPAIFLIDDIVQINRFVGKTREYAWTVRLFGVVKGFTFNEFEEHIADVEECLEDNCHLIGFASKCEINNVITDNQLFDNTNVRLYEMELRVEYIRCHTHPK